MFGFVVGTLCLFGLFGLMKAGRCGGGRHYGFHGRHGSYGRHGGGSSRRGGFGRAGFGRAAAEVFKRRLNVDEDQEGIVDLAFADLQTALTDLGAALRDGRTELAEAFRGEDVDEAAIASAFDRQDADLKEARRQAISALKQIHAVLDPDQRAKAVDWVTSTDARWV